MTKDNDTFSAPDEATPVWVSTEKQMDDIAFQIAQEFIDLGIGIREATSMSAHILVRAAWKVGGTGSIAGGLKPDPERFFKVCRRATKDIVWPDDQEGDETP